MKSSPVHMSKEKVEKNNSKANIGLGSNEITMVIFDGSKSLLLGVKTWGFETDFNEVQLILLIGCPSCHQKPSKMMESTLLNQNPFSANTRSSQTTLKGRLE